MLQLPGCMRCGRCGCVCGKLPYTLTVRFYGLENRTHSNHCELAFTSNFGCGAEAVVMAPGGCDDNEEITCGPSNRGGITQLLITEPGHDYARLGRVEPSLTITGSGSGAMLTATLAPVDDTLDEQCQSYKLTAVSVSGAGEGYSNGEQLKIETDGVVLTAAVATLTTAAAAPTLTADVPYGTGATLSVVVESIPDSSPPRWRVASVDVVDGGDGYTNGTAVSFGLGPGDQEVSGASATIVAGGPPADEDVVPDVQPPSTGTGATWSYTWTPVFDGYKLEVAVVNGGSGFQIGDLIFFVYDGNGNGYEVSDVDGNGAITAISFYGDYTFPAGGPGPITSVTVDDGGSYFKDTGVPESVVVVTPGEYYTEDPDAPVCLADVTVSLVNCDQIPVQLAGEESLSLHNASISATIGSDPTDKATWGTITGLTIDDPGAGYLAWRWLCLNQEPINDQPIVLVAQNPTRLVTLNVIAEYGAGGCLRVVPKGEGTVCSPPTDAPYDGQPGPIREVELLAGGNGYAVPGREEPDWTVAAYSYTFTPTFIEAAPDEFSRPRWAVDSVSIGGFGATQPDGWTLPQPAASAPPQPPTSTRITEPVERVEQPYVAIVHTRQQPTVTATAGGSGTGAELTVTLAESDEHPKVWRVASVGGGGGSGYAEGTKVTFSVPPRTESWGHFTDKEAIAVCEVDGDGAITSVTVNYGGAYYVENRIPQSIEVRSGGLFFRENPDLEPYVATVSVEVNQVPPSSGTGGAVSVTVETNIEDPDFGRLVTAALDSGGSNYTLLGGPQDCLYQAEPCGGSPVVELRLRGAGKQPELTLQDGRVWPGNYTVLRADEGVGDCDELPDTASLLYGAAASVWATIERGGVVTLPCAWPDWCDPCLCPADFIQPETSVTVESDIPCAGSGTAAFSGQWQDLDLMCGYRLTPEGEILYENDVHVSVGCCDRQCDEDAPCELKLYACVSGYAYDPATDTYCAVSGCSECVEFDVVGSDPVGTITVPVVACYPPNEVNYSLTITLGGS